MVLQAEAVNARRSIRELDWRADSQLFERPAVSQDKAGVLDLA